MERWPFGCVYVNPGAIVLAAWIERCGRPIDLVEMSGLSEKEWECLRRYVSRLAEELDGRLLEIRMFGSAAREDMWPARSPMHSDIDLLVVTRDEVDDPAQELLINETYPLFLEYGRQLSPHFFSRSRLIDPPDDRTREFLGHVERDGLRVWPAKSPLSE